MCIRDRRIWTAQRVKQAIDALAGVGAGVDDTAYGISWDGVTGIAPSKNALYDFIQSQVFKVDATSNIIPIFWGGTQAEYDIDFPSGHPTNYFVIITDGAVTPTNAADIVNVPSGNLVATDVQGALDELQTEVDGLSGGGSTLSTMAEIAAQDYKELISYNKEWMLPEYANSSYSVTDFNRFHNNIVIVGAANKFEYPINISFGTTAVAGNIAEQRGQVMAVGSGDNFHFQRGFFRGATSANDRFSIGLSSSYRLASPTNIEPNTEVNLLGVCKLSTSDNLHIIHNDGTGIATTFDLGASYPANDTTLYYYKLEIYGDFSTSVVIKVTRITRADGTEISTSQTVTTDLPAATISAFLWVSNNTDASIVDLRDRGAVKYIDTY